MTTQENYPIGIPGKPWGPAEKAQWLDVQTIKRSYLALVVQPILKIAQDMSELVSVEQYAALSTDPDIYRLFAIKTSNWQNTKPTILITGGVHGYETSGVLGALRFVETELAHYRDTFNFIVAPCISPWGFETINRWNPDAVDPNRSFREGGSCEESKGIINYVNDVDTTIIGHIDLHETTDTDNTEFRPALSARDAIEQKAWHIPDGFYAVGDSLKPAPELQASIINAVKQVTHIAPADENNQIIGADITQPGVINFPKNELGLCAGFTDAPFVCTTEVYPDSPKATDEICIEAQVAAVAGALNYIKTTL